MHAFTIIQQCKSVFSAIASKFKSNRYFIVLSLFLLAVLLISFIFPIINYGRFFGTDDYTHLFHTQEMNSSNGILDFYDKISEKVADPNSESNDFNYPFGLWLFGSIISKTTGLPVLNAELIFVIIFLFILLGSFYIYSSIFLESKEQKIFALLFLISMPSASLSLLSFRPSVFILPFLFILLYIVFKEPIQWKLFPIVWLSIFIITITHTGTFLFILAFSIIFFLLYCLFWGKFSRTIYMVIISMFVIYVLTIRYFPQILNQFEVKSILFLSPGNLFASKFHFYLPLELGNVLYHNIMVEQQFIYAIIMGAFIFAVGKTFMYIHRKVSEKILLSGSLFPFTIPSMNISKSIMGVPLWLGPIHLILSLLGIFRLDSKGKCILITSFLLTLAPDMLLTSQGLGAITGALREISYLIIIIPISAALGLWAIISYIDSLNTVRKSLITSAFWVLLLSAIIITPTIATVYYLPKISGEDYIIEGMQWLGGTGNVNEKVAGYGYRTVPIYTNKIDATYGIQNGYELRTFIALLKGVYFSVVETNVKDLQHYYGVDYIFVSNKLAENFKGRSNSLQIDNNQVLDKIYSSKDFGIYKIISQSGSRDRENTIVDNVTFERSGSAIEVKSKVYKIVLNENYPTIEQFGTPKDNYLGAGFMSDTLLIGGFRQNPVTNPFLPPNKSAPSPNSTIDHFGLSNMLIPAEIRDNQVIYRTILKDEVNGNNEASLLVRYTFYPASVKREFLISNDWVSTNTSKYMNVQFYTTFFTPMNEFQIVKNNSVLKRNIYPSEDSVIKNDIIKSLYLTYGDRGIYIKNEPKAPYPDELAYKGSTIYNMSSLRLSQTSSVKPGDTLQITQYLSPEVGGGTAVKNIQTHQGIELNNFPDGIVPLILSGYDKTLSGRGSNTINKGYQILKEDGIPYSEVIAPRNIQDNSINLSDIENSDELSVIPDTLTSVASTNEYKIFADKSIKIIGSANTGTRVFDNFIVQKNTISSLLKYSNSNDMTLIGYMPQSLIYNLDTLKIISDNKIPFIISRSVTPATYGYSGVKNRNPQLATIQSEPVDVVLLPVSYPTSSSLSYHSDNVEIFSAWKITIDDAMDDDAIAFFIFSASEIGDPEFSEEFNTLFSYAKNRGLTFTTPDVIVGHFKNLQNIQYHGSIDGDMATINLTNNNDHMVQNVTFKVSMPVLKSGEYKVNNGAITRTKVENYRIIVYVSTDIPAYGTQEITIAPENPRETIVVTIYEQPIEGDIVISIKDVNGYPVENTDVVIDSKYYLVDERGNVHVQLKRGIHDLNIQSPGFETYSSTLDVKGRMYFFFHNIGKNF